MNIVIFKSRYERKSKTTRIHFAKNVNGPIKLRELDDYTGTRGLTLIICTDRGIPLAGVMPTCRIKISIYSS